MIIRVPLLTRNNSFEILHKNIQKLVRENLWVTKQISNPFLYNIFPLDLLAIP